LRIKNKESSGDLKIKAIDKQAFLTQIPWSGNSQWMQLVQKNEFKLSCILPEERIEKELKFSDAPKLSPPTLVSLKGVPFFENFESPFSLKVRDRHPLRIKYDKQNGNSYMEEYNKRYGDRLDFYFNTHQPIFYTAILQFAYRGRGLDYFSVKGNKKIIQLNEPHVIKSLKVSWSDDMKLDNKWHYWSGNILDVVFSEKSTRLKMNSFYSTFWRFGSFARYDQTGKNSTLDIDNIILGPALNSLKNKPITPCYASHDKNIEVWYAIRAGHKVFDALDVKTQQNLVWHKTSNNKAITADLSEVKEGCVELYIKAIDSKGRASAVTSIPFLYDKTPLKATFIERHTKREFFNGSTLFLLIERDATSIDLKRLQLTCNGQSLPLLNHYNYFKRDVTKKTYVGINWIYLARKLIEQSKNGDVLTFKFTNIYDLAGNAHAPLSMALKIDYKADKLAPIFLNIQLPKKYYPYYQHRFLASNNLFFSTHRKISVKKNVLFNKLPMLEISSPSPQRGYLSLSNYGLSKHCFLALSYFDKLSVEDGLKFNLQVYTYNKKTHKYKNYILPVELPRGDKKHHYIIFDVTKMLLDKTNYDDENTRITKINFINFKDKFTIAMTQIAQFAGVSSEAIAKFKCIDRSGVKKEIHWTFYDETHEHVIAEGDADNTTFDLYKLKGVPKETLGWLDINISDRAGNKTEPYSIPLYINPTVKKVKNKADAKKDGK
jgi:hypothetical protein